MEYSYGIVPIYKNDKGECKFLLINQKSQKHSFRGFPKGHKEKSEIDIQAAQRELKEETGISKINIISNKKRSLQYTYNLSGIERKKKVFFRSGFVKNQEVFIQNLEINEYLRCSKEEILSKLTHKNVKIMFQKICTYLNIE